MTSRFLRPMLLVCGFLASLLYAAMLVFVPMQWEGYSSASWTVSELSAIGAPTRSLWVALGAVYVLLTVAFGVGVWLSAGRDRRLRVVGLALIAQSILSLVWPPMHLRGTAPTITDAMHIAFAVAWLLLMLIIMTVAAAALDKPFRLFTAATLVLFIVFGTVTGMDGPRIAANLPTPWIGVWERINIGASLLWVAVFAVMLVWRSRSGGTAAPARATGCVNGFVAPGFEEVRSQFERNFIERGEIGAAVAAYWRGEKVVDLWGGRRIPNGSEPWQEDTMVVVMSTTKGLSSMTLAVANSRGLLDYDERVARYWPEFAQSGKGAITVRQLLGHEAGLVFLDENLTIDRLRDLDDIACLLARQKPAWRPGTRHGYHAMTLGLYMQEIIRRVDPAHRTLGQFFHDEIAVPLGLEFYIGLPRGIRNERLAQMLMLTRTRGLRAIGTTPLPTLARMLWPSTLLRRSFVGLNPDWNDRRSYDVEIPAGNGVGTARAIARAYSAFALGGAELGITPATFTSITDPPRGAWQKDVVLGVPSFFSLGFLRPGPNVSFGSSARAFGAPGAGGSFAFADPDVRLGYAYVMNNMGFRLVDDPREKPLRDAIYRAIAGIEEAERRPEAISRGALVT